MATYRQRLFVQNLIKTGNPAEAAALTYSIKGKNPRHIATNIASENLKKPAVRNLLEIEGELSLENLFKVLKRNLDAKHRTWVRPLNQYLVNDDTPAQLKALELALRLKGYLSRGGVSDSANEAERMTVNISFLGLENGPVGVPPRLLYH